MLHRSGRGERAMDRKGRKTHSFVALFLVTGLLLASLTRASGQQERQADRNKQLVLAVASLDVEQTRQCLRDGADPNLLVGLSLSLPPFTGPRQLFQYPVTRQSRNVTTLLQSIMGYAYDSKAKQKAPHRSRSFVLLATVRCSKLTLAAGCPGASGSWSACQSRGGSSALSRPTV